MRVDEQAALAHWLGLMELWRRYFGYTVEGIDHLATHECQVVVGYHGRPLAYDLFLLGAEIHRRQGYLPLALMHRKFMDMPYPRWLIDGLDWAVGRGPVMEQAVATGRHIIIAPGGELEGLRPGWVRDEVEWGHHMGYLSFAIKRKLDVVPVAAAGVDDAYFGLVDSHGWAERLGLASKRAAFAERAPRLDRVLDQFTPWWTGVGPLGLFPFSPPFPVRIHQIVGQPITAADYAGLDPRDPEALAELHAEVQARVQGLLGQARRALRSRRADRALGLRERLAPLVLGRR